MATPPWATKAMNKARGVKKEKPEPKETKAAEKSESKKKQASEQVY